MSTDIGSTVRFLRAVLGDDMRSVQEMLRAPAKRQPRKNVKTRACHGKEVACLPGLSGKCTACFEED